MKTKLRSFVFLAAATLLLAACRVVVDTTIEADGSGILRSAIVYSAAEKNSFEQKPENASKSICDDLQTNVPADATFSEEARGEETFCVTTRSFDDLANLRKLYGGMGKVTVNQLGFELGKLTLDLDIDLSSADDTKGPAQEWQLTLPGKLGANNADRVDGQTLVWTVPPGEKTHLRAESDAGLNTATLGTPGLLVLAAVLAVGVILGLVLALLMRRRK